jgi:hypothetical protein
MFSMLDVVLSFTGQSEMNVLVPAASNSISNAPADVFAPTCEPLPTDVPNRMDIAEVSTDPVNE